MAPPSTITTISNSHKDAASVPHQSNKKVYLISYRTGKELATRFYSAISQIGKEMLWRNNAHCPNANAVKMIAQLKDNEHSMVSTAESKVNLTNHTCMMLK